MSPLLIVSSDMSDLSPPAPGSGKFIAFCLLGAAEAAQIALDEKYPGEAHVRVI